mgnify:CR=1 FL=1
MTELGKQVWLKMEEMGWENAPENFHLEYYEDIIECTKQALNIAVVVGRSEQLTCPRCKSTNILNPDKDNDAQCIECAFIWAG